MNMPITTQPQLTATQEKLMNLLSQGFPASVVAQATGCDESYVSQMLAVDWFANLVQEKKFLALQKHTNLDNMYDSLEEKLLQKLDKASAMLIKPQDITRTLQMVNTAKRKGMQSGGPATITQTYVSLTLPTAILSRFISNAQNQIVEVQDGTGNQNTLVTATTGTLERLSREASEAQFTELPSSGSAEGTENFQGKTIESRQLKLSAEIGAAQEGLKKGLRLTQAITADDL